MSAKLITVLLIALGSYSTVLQQDTDYALTPDSTLDEVIRTLETAHEQYNTLHIQTSNYNHIGEFTIRDEVWVSQLEGAYRWEMTTTTSEGEVIQNLDISDGEYVYTTRSLDGEPVVMLNVLEPSSIVKGLGVVTTVIAPEVVASRLSEPDAQIEIVGVETITERETLKVMYTSEWSIMNFWIDTEMGILMQHEILTPDGELVRTVTVDSVEFDPVFEDAEPLFYVDASAYDPERIREMFPRPQAEVNQ